MGRANYLQNNFTSGEVSPRIDIRTDLVRYKNGLATLQNMTIMPHGGVTSRLGTIFTAAVRDSADEVRLIDFRFSSTQSYAMELGDTIMRFYRNSGQIRLTAQDVTNITQANPAVVTYSGSDTYANGDRVVLSGVLGMTEVNSVEFTVANVNTGANTFELSGVNSTGYTAYSSGGTVEEIYEITTPWADSEVFAIRKAQSADVMYMTHPSHPVQQLSRLGDTNWTIAEADIQDGPYAPIEDNDITLTLSATSGTVTVTASAALFAATDTSGTGGTGVYDRHLRVQDKDTSRTITGITKASPAVVTYSGPDVLANGDTVYISGVSGMTQVNGNSYKVANIDTSAKTYELENIDSTGYGTYTSGGVFNKSRDSWKWLKITGYTSTTVVTATVESDDPLGIVGPYDVWRLGAWSTTTGFPETVKFHENRVIYGGNDAYKDTVWASAQDDYLVFSPGTDDDDAWEYTLAAEQLNSIQWLSPQKTLRIGTAGSEWSMSGQTINEAITPTSVKLNRETVLGSGSIDALLIENATLFWQRSGRKLREFVYSFDVDSFVAPDISLISEHITQGGIVEMAYQAEPDGIVWIPRGDGVLLGLTYLRGQDVVGWHRHVLGGTSAKVKSATTIPDSGQDQLWVVVERTINGATKKYIERMGPTFERLTITDAKFTDSNASFTGLTRSATLTPGATTGTGITLTAGSSVFTSDDVGRIIRGNGGKAEITAQGGTTVTVDILIDFNDTTAIAAEEWTLSSNTITGLNHLEGETVTILADGGVHPDRLVTAGAITLNEQYTTVHIGLGYTQILESLDIEAGSELGSSQGNRSRVTEMTLRFYETVGGKVGKDSTKLTQLDFRKPSDPMNEGVPLFTGEKIIRPNHKWGDSAQVYVTQDQPLPMTLLGYVAKVQTSDAA